MNSFLGVTISNKVSIRCQQHDHGPIIAVVADNGFFVKCADRSCKRWTKITLNIPGVKLNLTKVGISQELLPLNYHIDHDQAVTAAEVVEGSR